MTEKLWTTKEVCEYLCISLTKLNDMISFKEIPYIKLGRSIRFNRADLEKWLKKKTQLEKAG